MRNASRTSSAAQEVAAASSQATPLVKTMLLGASLTLAAATPSIAQSYDPDVGSGNIVPYYQAAQPDAAQSAWNRYVRIAPRSARGAYARVGPGAGWSTPGGPNDQGGTDPDPNIRFQLNRESLQGRW